MLTVVNGYVCRSSCDEAVARKGRDPRNPTGNPVKAEMLAVRDGKPYAATGARALAFDATSSTVSPGPSPYASQAPARLLDVYA